MNENTTGSAAKSARNDEFSQEIFISNGVATVAFSRNGYGEITNGTGSTIHYDWGKDLSGDLQGAGGVGGLLYLTVGDSVYVPLYDNNGNITRYLDAIGNTVALYTYDAFGNLLSRSGPLADLFRHRFSTKYFDVETGLYYYGYRFYHPSLMRWLTRDPIEEEGGENLYAFCSNNTLSNCDALGIWATQWFSLGKPRLVYRKQRKDTIASLAEKAGLEASEVSSWAKGGKTRWNASSGVALSESNFSDYCFVSVPNVWIDADLLCGGGFKDMIINIGGTIGSFWGTDLFTSGNHKIITVRSTDQLLQTINTYKGHLWGMSVYGHGSPDGYISGPGGSGQMIQMKLIDAIKAGGYKLHEINMMQCFSWTETDVDGQRVDFKKSWKEISIKNDGYHFVNILGLDIDI